LYTLRVWKKDLQQEFNVEMSFESGSDAYLRNGLNVLDKFFIPAVITSNEEAISNQLQQAEIYPNPNNGKFQVSLGGNSEGTPMDFVIVDVSGRIIDHRIVPTTSLITESYDLSKLSNGMYFLQMTSGNTSTTQKINITR